MNDKNVIDQLASEFFNLFTNKKGKTLELEHIYNICIADTLIIKNVQGQTETYTLESFISPRKEILSNGTLTDFSEYELDAKTQIFGHIAQRFCIYEKSGKLNGSPFKSLGMKTFQFIKTAGHWKICAMAWDDESKGVKVNLE